MKEKERECVKSLKAFEVLNKCGTTLNTNKSEARDPRHINPSKAARKTREKIGSKGLPVWGRKRRRRVQQWRRLREQQGEDVEELFFW